MCNQVGKPLINLLKLLIFLFSTFHTFHSQSSNSSDRVRFFLFNNNWNSEESQELFPGNLSSVQNSAFNRSIFTIFLTHGFGGNLTQIKPLLAGHLEAKRVGTLSSNILYADYSSYAGKNSPPWSAWWTYHIAVGNLPNVANQILAFLNDMIGWGMLTPEGLHMLSISLGSQLLGLVGSKFQEENGGRKIRRITGMEPSGNCFGPGRVGQALSKDDAEFVDVVHSDWKHFGSDRLGGTVDFIVNTGMAPQPGCNKSISNPCSHGYAQYLYADSLKNQWVSCQLPDGMTPDNLTIPTSGNCNNPIAFGPYAPMDIKGSYYVNASTFVRPPTPKGDAVTGGGGGSGQAQEDWTWIFTPCRS